VRWGNGGGSAFACCPGVAGKRRITIDCVRPAGWAPRPDGEVGVPAVDGRRDWESSGEECSRGGEERDLGPLRSGGVLGSSLGVRVCVAELGTDALGLDESRLDEDDAAYGEGSGGTGGMLVSP